MLHRRRLMMFDEGSVGPIPSTDPIFWCPFTTNSLDIIGGLVGTNIGTAVTYSENGGRFNNAALKYTAPVIPSINQSFTIYYEVRNYSQSTSNHQVVIEWGIHQSLKCMYSYDPNGNREANWLRTTFSGWNIPERLCDFTILNFNLTQFRNMIFSYNSVNRIFKFYINDELVLTRDVVDNMFINITTNDMFVGAGVNGSSLADRSNSWIRNLKIWNVAN
jgi:hypothetical protein